MDKWRYHPAIEELGRLASAETLGAVYAVATRRLDSTHRHVDVDCTWILLPHDLSIATEILGRAPIGMSATASFDGGHAVALISHLRAGHAYTISMISTHWLMRVRMVEIAFADGVATFDFNHEATIVLMRGKHNELRTISVPFIAPLRRELEGFAAHAIGLGPPPKSSFADGLETVRTIERLRELAGIIQN